MKKLEIACFYFVRVLTCDGGTDVVIDDFLDFGVLGFFSMGSKGSKEFFIVYIKLRDKELSYAEEEDK